MHNKQAAVIDQHRNVMHRQLDKCRAPIVYLKIMHKNKGANFQNELPPLATIFQASDVMETQALVLLVDEEYEHCLLMQQTLARIGVKTHISHHMQQAKHFFNEYHYHACVTDLDLADGSGIELVNYLVRYAPHTMTIVLSTASQLDRMHAALLAGAFDCVSKPLAPQQLQQLIQRALQQYATQTQTQIHTKQHQAPRFTEQILIGQSKPMLELRNHVQKIADAQTAVFIHGESGTGKGTVAKLIHQLSLRRDGPYVVINCAAMNELQFDYELFGQPVPKAECTEPDQSYPSQQGLLQAANGGSLFLDEVAELSLSMQVKLLYALQDQHMRNLSHGSGHGKGVELNLRILSASHRDLRQQVQQGLFRQDLFFRLHVIDLYIPPLRMRGQDILLLAEHFIQQMCLELKSAIKQLSTPARRYLLDYAYAGNVRELSNMLERALILSETITIEIIHLQPSTSMQHWVDPIDSKACVAQQVVEPCAAEPHVLEPSLWEQLPAEGLVQFLEKMEREILIQALHLTRWNRTQAAKKLGMSFRSLRYRLKKLGLE